MTTDNTMTIETAKNNKKQLVCFQRYESPCGEIILASVEDELCLCYWNAIPSAIRQRTRIEHRLNAKFKEETSAVITRARAQLDEYFPENEKYLKLP